MESLLLFSAHYEQANLEQLPSQAFLLGEKGTHCLDSTPSYLVIATLLGKLPQPS
jgi:hypothetical protein